MNRRFIIVKGVLWALFIALSSSESGESAMPDKRGTRKTFVDAIGAIKEGMSKAQVLETLGQPDDVRTQAELPAITITDAVESWCYGAKTHLDFPTLGQVYFGSDEKVRYVFGGHGRPADTGLFEEQKLRQLLRLIDRAPSFDGHRYNPLNVIRIVNALQPLGKERSLAAIDEYLRVSPYHDSSAREGLFLVLRVLFDVPEKPGYMPTMFVGAARPVPPPQNPKRLPRFPILLTEDVPLLLVAGYDVAGEPQAVAEHVDYFRKNGQIRTGPLVPSAAPLALLDKIEKSLAWIFRDVNRPQLNREGRALLMNQLLRLTESVHDVETDEFGYKISLDPNLEARWSRIVREFDKREIRWDARQNDYTLKQKQE